LTYPTTSVSFEWEYENPLTFDIVDILVEATVSPYDPGRRSGPPEDCYPPEGGEIEDLSISKEDGEPFIAPWPVRERMYHPSIGRGSHLIPFDESLYEIIQEKAEEQAYSHEEF